MTPPAHACQHCGSPIPSGRTDTFCCAGCAYVHDLLLGQGLQQYYELRGNLLAPPVPAQSLREQDYVWLEQLSTAAAIQHPQQAELRLAVQGMSCIGCVWLAERVFARHAGGLRLVVDVVHGEMTLTWLPGVFDIVAFARDYQAFGYLLGPPRAEDSAATGPRSTELGRRMAVCGAFAMNAMAFSLPAYFGMPDDFIFARWFELITVASATLAMLVGGSYFIAKAWRALALGALHIDVPIALGILTAYAGSLGGWLLGVKGLLYFDFVAIFIFLMLLGRHTQQSALERNKRRLMQDTSIPDKVKAWDSSNAESWRSLDALEPGTRYEIKPGQAVPLASRLLDSSASISLEWINGESEAQFRQEGELLPSGALNIASMALKAEALESWESSTLRHLLQARRGQDYRDPGLERLLRWYIGVVLMVGVTGAVVWWWQGAGIAAALQVMISIFVVSCPCALGVAVPLAEELAVARAGRLGAFVRTQAFWKRLLRVRRVVFDKTGTLTMENPALQNPDALRHLNDEAHTALRTLVSGNLHPISRSLFDAAGPGRTWLHAAVEEVLGSGLSILSPTAQRWTLGRPGAWNITAAGDALLACDGQVVASFSFQETLRDESRNEVQRLHLRGLEVHVLSGDRPEKVAAIAQQLGLPADACHASMSPAEKAGWLKARDREDTLYIGDGANDSLAFDAALCAGSPITGRSFLEQKADFYFLGHSLRFICPLLDLAALHRRATRRVFAFSVLYNIATVAAGLLGHLSPLAAAVLMPLSSLVTLALVSFTFRRHGTPHGSQDSLGQEEMPTPGLETMVKRMAEGPVLT
ncbi:MAG: heavy metal translocating P-type ATPase metal-binding domain-containing protein [Prosthecobacter sp.]